MSIDALNNRSKITPGHLKKRAYLYVRQSTLRQVFEIPRAPNVNMRCVSGRLSWAGLPSTLRSSIATKVNRELPRPSEKVSRS